MKKTKTRILLASLFFDLGLTESAMYQPTVTIYFDFTKEEKPIHFHIKYKWSSYDFWFPFSVSVKKMFSDSGLTKQCIFLIKENVLDYDGNFYIDFKDAYYISTKGQEIGFVKDFKTAKKLYQDG